MMLSDRRRGWRWILVLVIMVMPMTGSGMVVNDGDMSGKPAPTVTPTVTPAATPAPSTPAATGEGPTTGDLLDAGGTTAPVIDTNAPLPDGIERLDPPQPAPKKRGKLIAWHWNLVDAKGKRTSRDIPCNTPYGRTADNPEGHAKDLEAQGFKILNSNPVFENMPASDEPGTPPADGGSTPSPTPTPTNPPPGAQVGEDGAVKVPCKGICQYNNCPPLEKAVANMSCGPTSLAMVLRYYGIDVTPAQLVPPTGCTSRGTGYGGMVSAAKKYGYSANWSTGPNMTALKSQLKAGNPVVVSTKEYGGHFMVVTGFLPNGDIIANDPADYSRKIENKIYKLDKFVSIWDGMMVMSK